MILSNSSIVRAIADGDIVIDPPLHDDAGNPPYNTTTVDLRLGARITVPRAVPATQRLDQRYDSRFVAENSDDYVMSRAQPFRLDPERFVLAKTVERISLPIRPGRRSFAGRVEGKSSRARLGMLVHFSAPTIHSGFEGHLALEMINLGPNSIEVLTASQFRGQRTAAGERSG